MSEPETGGGVPRSGHVPVLVQPVLEYLDPQPGQLIVDGTVGGGGHAERILERIGPRGVLVALDRDSSMLELATTRLAADNCHPEHASYADLPDVLAERFGEESSPVDGVLLDLGIGSDQLDDPERGFGFDSGQPLDMRFDRSTGRPAWQLLRDASREDLERWFREYGEERRSRAIARAIVDGRRREPVKSGRDLARVVADVAGPGRRRNPATRVFQALRIEVNGELDELSRSLADGLPRCLAGGGRLVVIAFHSLEDRIVKQAFQDKDTWQVLTRRPIRPSAAECRINPRSRSARLRAAVRR